MAQRASLKPHQVKRLKKSSGRSFTGSPAQVALALFLLINVAFGVLLSLPFASADHRPTPIVDAFFTATSAVSVTGLTTLNTAEHWSFAGQILILLAIQIGGLGILTIAAILTMAVSKHLGLRQKLFAQEGMSTGRLGEVGTLIKVVLLTSVVIEGLLFILLLPRIWVLEKDFLAAAWHSIFYTVSSFNNAGFVTHSNGLADLGHDPYIAAVLSAGVFIGSLGFPLILVVVRQKWNIRRWNLHSRLTLEFTIALALLGAVLYALLEWNNPATMGERSVAERLGMSMFASISARSGGFTLVEVSDQLPQTLLVTDALMFIGGGAASTAGGIKVTTLAVILLAILAEVRGQQDLIAHRRRVPVGILRVAVSVVAMSVFLIFTSTLILTTLSGEGIQRPLFEVISAFATTGLSTGLSAELPTAGKVVLTILMFVGRLGPITFASALAIRQRQILYRYPEERPIIG